MVYVNSKGSDQPEHLCGLILLFYVHYFSQITVGQGPTALAVGAGWV